MTPFKEYLIEQALKYAKRAVAENASNPEAISKILRGLLNLETSLNSIADNDLAGLKQLEDSMHTIINSTTPLDIDTVKQYGVSGPILSRVDRFVLFDKASSSYLFYRRDPDFIPSNITQDVLLGGKTGIFVAGDVVLSLEALTHSRIVPIYSIDYFNFGFPTFFKKMLTVKRSTNDGLFELYYYDGKGYVLGYGNKAIKGSTGQPIELILNVYSPYGVQRTSYSQISNINTYVVAFIDPLTGRPGEEVSKPIEVSTMVL